ncbi:MAG: hypothetical protein HY268_18420 [Deltaproteobacteria bacterium]|nr:hypothetical protein [Deltaproteobacteria bacterium]
MTTTEFFQSTPVKMQKTKEARKAFTKAKLEEAAGIFFITISFFLTGWFYYELYQALHDFAAF